MTSQLRSTSPFATLVYQLAVRSRAGCIRRMARIIRRCWLKLDDPPVRYHWPTVGALAMPLSHDLGLIAQAVPEYSHNLGRLAAVLAQAQPQFLSVDVGANIGDSALLLRLHGAGRVLCVEGAPEFLPYLRANAADDDRIEIIETFVRAGEVAVGQRISERGSSHFTPQAAATMEHDGMALTEIMAVAPGTGGATVRLLKIDTDGLDLSILAANMDWLAANRPVIFFEYLPYFFRPHGTNPERILNQLVRVGYQTAIVYDNFGRMVCAIDLATQWSVLTQVLAYYERDDNEVYADIALFSAADRGLAENIAAAETRRNAAARKG